MKQLTLKEDHHKKQRSLFQQCVFLLNREVPIYSLQYLVMSFGGAFALEEDEDFLKKNKVTHHVMDRPLQGKTVTNREYVQPQWIVDSLNNLYLLPTAPYKPGQAPPPHLSPFTDSAKEGYIPQRQKEILALKGEAVDDLSESESDEEVANEDAKPQAKDTKSAKPEAQPVKSTKNKGDADSSSEDEDSEEEAAVKQKKAKNAKLKKELQKE